MTDKQIIFDDVDVKDCIAYAKSQTVYLGNTVYKQMEKICMVKNQPCKFFDCQFKQMARELKRSEAQCEAMFVSHTDLEKKYKAKEQECEELKKIIDEAKNSKLDLNSFFAIEATVGEYQLELDQLKAEVKSKTEYIQEQRDIINQYSKEIEMYKKCQGKRASKREEELKAENEELKRQRQADKGLITSTGKMNYQLLQEYDKLKTELTEIKEIAEGVKGYDPLAKQILQKISKCEVGND